MGAATKDGASLTIDRQGGLILVPLGLSHSSAAVLLGRLEHGEVVFWDGCDPPIWNCLPVPAFYTWLGLAENSLGR